MEKVALTTDRTIAGPAPSPDMLSHRTSAPRVWKPLLACVAVGALLRATVLAISSPSVLTYYGGDSIRYLRLDASGFQGLFSDNAMPAGYPGFLQGLAALSDHLAFTTATQHILGVVAALLLFAAVRRADGGRPAALAAAGVVLLSGDQVFLEHGILTESLWFPLLALALFAVSGAIGESHRRLRWLLIGGALIGLSALARHVSEVLLLVVAAWAALAFGGSVKARLTRGGAVLGPGLAILVVYYAVSVGLAGGYSGLTENSGFSLYGRTGQFADCTRFTPPKGTRALCSPIPPEQRAGTFYWQFNPKSPIYARIAFEAGSRSDQKLLGSFGRAAILHQPLDYARAVTKDLARFVVPDVGVERPDSGITPELMSFESTVPVAQAVNSATLARQFSEKYDGVGDGSASQASRTILGAYQSVFRLNGLLLLALLATASAGLVRGRGAARTGCGLFLSSSIALFVLPVATSAYDARYAVAPGHLLTAAAGLGLTALAARRRAACRR